MNRGLQVLWLFGVLVAVIPGRALAGPISTDFTLGSQTLFGGQVQTTGVYDLTESYPGGQTALSPAMPTDQLNPTTNFLMVLETVTHWATPRLVVRELGGRTDQRESRGSDL